MYLDSKNCAQCGKLLSVSAKYAPHNHALNELRSSFEYPPLFCSQKCIETVIASSVPSPDDIEQHWAERKSREIQAIKDRLDAEIKRAQQDEQEALAKPYADKEFNNRITAARIRDLKARAEQNAQQLSAEVRQWLEYSLNEHHKTKVEKTAQAMLAFFSEYEAAKERQEADKPAAIDITDQQRFEHTHILGPSGSGKTTLLQDLIIKDLQRPDRPAMVIIDPKGFMVERIAKLKFLNPNDIIYIDPNDDPAAPLNLFSANKLTNQTIANFDYIFSQSGTSLSSFMRPAFRFCARLMFTMPNPSIFKLMDLLESEPNDPQFQPYIDALQDEGAKRFFQKDFHNPKRYAGTRDQIKVRFQDILSMPEIMRMFSSQAPSIDFLDALQRRKVVLVNTAFRIGEDVSKLLGRYIITLTLAAAFARGRGGNPAFLYIDEFQDYVDEEATPRHLRLAREYNLGIVFAHQQMFCNEFTDSLRSSVSNATVKYSSKLTGYDRRYMLADLGCEEEFLDQQVPDHVNRQVRFACSVKGHPPFSVAIPYPNITEEMQRSSLPAMSWPETNERPPEESGSHATNPVSTEAAKPIVARENITKPSPVPPTNEISDAAAEYDL